jgi:hypothetical protein
MGTNLDAMCESKGESLGKAESRARTSPTVTTTCAIFGVIKRALTWKKIKERKAARGEGM